VHVLHRIALALLVGVVSTLGACSGATSNVLLGSGPLVTVEMRGGLCQAGPCDATVLLERDGRVHTAAKPPNDLGVASREAMAALTAAIAATDFGAVRAKRFEGECPVNFDGQELVFDFDAPGGLQRIASCEVAIDWGSPLFVAVGAALGEWVPLPMT
jgi:hypothetical protein